MQSGSNALSKIFELYESQTSHENPLSKIFEQLESQTCVENCNSDEHTDEVPQETQKFSRVPPSDRQRGAGRVPKGYHDEKIPRILSWLCIL